MWITPAKPVLHNIQPYSKSKLELDFNLSEILPVNCELSVIRSQIYATKLKLENLKFVFKCKKES